MKVSEKNENTQVTESREDKIRCSMFKGSTNVLESMLVNLYTKLFHAWRNKRQIQEFIDENSKPGSSLRRMKKWIQGTRVFEREIYVADPTKLLCVSGGSRDTERLSAQDFIDEESVLNLYRAEKKMDLAFPVLEEGGEGSAYVLM